MQTERLSLNILVAGVQLPLDHMTVMKLVIASSVRQAVPVAELVITDNPGVFDTEVTLSDGTPVVIEVGTSSSASREYQFRVFRHQKVPSASGASYKIMLYYDNPLYWHGTTTVPWVGTSSEAIDYIARTCKLSAMIDTTVDTMTWIPMNDRYCKWATRIASAGYFDDSSGFMLGLQMDGTLVYKNVAGYKYTENLPLLTTGASADQNRVPIRGHKVITTSGYDNFTGAYHQSQMSQSIIDITDEGKLFSNVQKVRATHDLSMNQDVKSKLHGARMVTVSPIDAGNTHENYHKAVYQNKRLRKVSSNHLAALSDVVTRLDLLDQVRVQVYEPPVNGEPKLNFNVSGYYFISAKTVYVGPEGFYCERYQLSRDGHNLDAGNSQQDV